MAELSESLADEQQRVLRVLSEMEAMVISAISAQCAGCSTAKFAPNRIARAVVNDQISEEAASGIAARFANCPGFQNEDVPMCHYPPPEN